MLTVKLLENPTGLCFIAGMPKAPDKQSQKEPRGLKCDGDFDEVMRQVLRVKPEKPKKNAKRKK